MLIFGNPLVHDSVKGKPAVFYPVHQTLANYFYKRFSPMNNYLPRYKQKS